MKPYYEHAGITIYHGDCREMQFAVDSIVTDPVWPNAPDGMFPTVLNPAALLRQMFFTNGANRVAIILRHDCDPRFLLSVPPEYSFFRTMILPYVMPGYIGRNAGLGSKTLNHRRCRYRRNERRAACGAHTRLISINQSSGGSSQ